jgi:hypothetical protein
MSGEEEKETASVSVRKRNITSTLLSFSELHSPKSCLRRFPQKAFRYNADSTLKVFEDWSHVQPVSCQLSVMASREVHFTLEIMMLVD